MKKLFVTIVLALLYYGGAYCQTETHFIYEDRSPSSEYMSVYAADEGGNITGFKLRNAWDASTHFDIDLTAQSFSRFRDAFEKFLEWESVAVGNNVEKFEREIPVAVISHNGTWRSYDSRTRGSSRVSNREMVIIFKFKWNPSNTAPQGASLDTIANAVQTDGLDRTSVLIITNMNSEAVRRFLDNTTEEKVLTAVRQSREQNRQRELEQERQRQLQDELFN
jgi:hypothetical protein